jgi:hypothetical protein
MGPTSSAGPGRVRPCFATLESTARIATLAADRTRRLLLLAALLSLLGLTAIGCGSPSPVAEVSGIVLLDGKPMPDALVEFCPDPEKGTHGPVSAATTDEEGRFHLVSHDQRDGAVVGSHRVLIQDARSIPQAVTDFTKVKPPPVQPSRISHIYGSAASTLLRQEVKPGPQTVTLEIKSKAGK